MPLFRWRPTTVQRLPPYFCPPGGAAVRSPDLFLCRRDRYAKHPVVGAAIQVIVCSSPLRRGGLVAIVFRHAVNTAVTAAVACAAAAAAVLMLEDTGSVQGSTMPTTVRVRAAATPMRAETAGGREWLDCEGSGGSEGRKQLLARTSLGPMQEPQDPNPRVTCMLTALDGSV